MFPLIVIAASTSVIRLVGFLFGIPWLDGWVPAVTGGLAIMFALMAVAHFAQPRRDALIAMVPPRLPRAATLVTVTGVLELAGAVGLVIPSTSRLAAICLGLLLIVMFPANVHAARAQTGIRTMPLPTRALVQVVFLAACAIVAIAPAI